MDFIDSTLDKKEEHCALFNGYLYEVHQKEDGESKKIMMNWLLI